MTQPPEIKMWFETEHYRLDRVNALLERCHLTGIRYQILHDNGPERARFNLSTTRLSAKDLKQRLEHDPEVLELHVWVDTRESFEGMVHADFYVEAK